MKASANITGQTSPTNRVVLKRALKYGDKFMVEKMGLDTESMTTGNFQNIALFTERGGFGAVSQFQRLDKQALDYLIKIQPVDACPFDAKMAFLCGQRTTSPDRPYWTRGGDWKDLLDSGFVATIKSFVKSLLGMTVSFEFGTIVFGGQIVQVESVDGMPKEYKFWAQYQQAPAPEWITFYKLIGLRKTDWARPVADLMAEGLIQRGTWAGSGNSYHDTWHSGVVLHPIWSELDYPSNNGPLYLAKSFTE